MSLFRRKPKRSSRAELADIFADGSDLAPEPEFTIMPCGERVYYMPIVGGSPYVVDFRGEEMYERDIARHEATCDVCHALVSHPDFGLEWTA